MRKTKISAALLVAWFFTSSCSTDYKDLASKTGRNAVLELAENHLTSGNCDAALAVLAPLLQPPHVDYDSRLLEASAYACKGGLNFPRILSALKNVSGSDIWSALVSSNYSSGSQDGHIQYLSLASDSLRKTSSESAPFGAVYRSADANSYMIFVQANLIGSVISPLGAANSTTGKRTRALNCAANCSNADRCYVQVAVSTIADSLNYVSTGTAIDKVSAAILEACQIAFGGSCPTNLSIEACLNTALLRTQGELLIDQIEAAWSI